MKKLKLKNIDPGSTPDIKERELAEELTKKYQKEIGDLLYLMYAENKHSLLVVLHGIDTSGKDGTVKNLFAEVNPQGIQVHAFKSPSEEELRHDFLWRCHKKTPESGMTVIFNRSYYEEVSVVRVHPDYLKKQHLPDKILKDKHFFRDRYEQINQFESMLAANGTKVVKLMLHISKGEQIERINARLDDPRKNWKYSPDDLVERVFWDEHMKAFQNILDHTHTEKNPWMVIPADKKWYRDYLVSQHLVGILRDLKMKFPVAEAAKGTKTRKTKSAKQAVHEKKIPKGDAKRKVKKTK